MPSKKPNRLDKIYTRSGDQGETSLALGKRLSKQDNHIKALGDVDELNCQIGIVIAFINNENGPVADSTINLQNEFKTIQNTLFDIGAELAMDNQDYPSLNQHFIDLLEKNLDQINATLPPLKEFILPGGTLSASQCHLARAICRRTERQLIQLANEKSKQGGDSLFIAQPIKYINRLSDYLFVAARYLNLQNQQAEIYWKANEVHSD